jgi:hypothetical protein
MTRLAYAMEKLKITEKTLGNLLNVDKSLVNKWKNRRRPFTSVHPQFNKAVERIAEIYSKSNADLKRAFLSQLPANYPSNAKELMHWFFTSGDTSPTTLNTKDLSENLEQTYVFSSCNEMDIVLGKFFSLLSRESGGKLQMMFGDFTLCAPSCSAKEQLKASLSALLTRNIKIEFIMKSD